MNFDDYCRIKDEIEEQREYYRSEKYYEDRRVLRSNIDGLKNEKEVKDVIRLKSILKDTKFGSAYDEITRCIEELKKKPNVRAYLTLRSELDDLNRLNDHFYSEM